MQINKPKWHRDMEIYLDIYTVLILEGNVNDLQAWVYIDEESSEHIKTEEYLFKLLSEKGYEDIVFYNWIDGFYDIHNSDSIKSFIGRYSSEKNENISVQCASSVIRDAMNDINHSSAVIFNMTSPLFTTPDALSEMELECISKLFLASGNKRQALSLKTGELINNVLIIVVEKTNDLPAWFYLNNPFAKQIIVTKPDKALRENYIANRTEVFFDYQDVSVEDSEKAVDDLINLTEGFSNVELQGLINLCESRKISIKKIKEAVNLFKYGESESKWDLLEYDRIVEAREILTQRVKGQEEAINKTLEVISRATLGMSNIQNKSAGKPRGILFFAGPTGTGKTEIAKAIAELIFGDESFLTRFDMSEYQHSHSDQKLLGAPPGYIGYGSGGQLTNAVKEKPFSILLFDEIDKADPSILDKFLQILEDGRMTDSSGETVHFSETLIIFTSNLGTIEKSENGISYENINSNMNYQELRSRMMESIRKFFRRDIRRPELLNRIGDNIVVFDYIREPVLDEILENQKKKIKANMLREKNIEFDISDEAYKYLHERALENLDNGGRGVLNALETYLINPLSEYMLKNDVRKDAKIFVKEIATNGELII